MIHAGKGKKSLNQSSVETYIFNLGAEAERGQHRCSQIAIPEIQVFYGTKIHSQKIIKLHIKGFQHCLY